MLSCVVVRRRGREILKVGVSAKDGVPAAAFRLFHAWELEDLGRYLFFYFDYFSFAALFA
tara:strand:+ start:618 stop:797 length:180 start_codon:yes stop_codon:yes gene_type:complete